jgi:hypothetical protein
MAANTTGASNVAMGALALDANTTASNNTAIGFKAMTANTTGAGNTAVGSDALDECTTGGENTACGSNAGGATTTGIQNVYVGERAGNYVTGHTSGNYGTYLGMVARPSSSTVNFEVVIGRAGIGKGDNTGFLAPTSGVYQGNNSSSWSTTSDRRIKKNIEDNNTGLDAIKEIQVKNFEYRTEDEITDFENPASAVVHKEGVQLGVIAQEIETILPDVVTTQSTGVKAVNPDNLTWYLVNAVQELSSQVDELKTEIQTLKGE